MATRRAASAPSHSDSPSSAEEAAAPPAVHDDFLVTAVAGGDAAALSQLMDRYDRLVRYAIYRLSKDRCLKDPHWLETVASDTWTGFVRSVTRETTSRPGTVRSYLVQIARNRCISALRRDATREAVTGSDLSNAQVAADQSGADPVAELAEIEELEALRGCLSELEGEDRRMAGQLEAITERRWRDAASALGVSESTLRSRWQRTVARLRKCLDRKAGKTAADSLAPGHAPGDL